MLAHGRNTVLQVIKTMPYYATPPALVHLKSPVGVYLFRCWSFEIRCWSFERNLGKLRREVLVQVCVQV